MFIASISLSSSSLTYVAKSKPCHSFRTCDSSAKFASSLYLPAVIPFTRSPIYQLKTLQFSPTNTTRVLRISVSAEDVSPSDTPIENTQQIISTEDSGTSTIISILLFAAFVGLSILTVGVVYLAVTDFLQKRERDKLDKEEVAKKKKKRGKVKARSRAGPRGFGQKIDDDYDDDDD